MNGVCSENEGSGGGRWGPSEPPQTRMQTLTPDSARAGPFGPWPKIPPQFCLFLATEQECSGHREMVRREAYKAEFFSSSRKRPLSGLICCDQLGFPTVHLWLWVEFHFNQALSWGG